MGKKRIEKKKSIQPNGTMIPQKDWFKPMKNIGIFSKPKIERNNKPNKLKKMGFICSKR